MPYHGLDQKEYAPTPQGQAVDKVTRYGWTMRNVPGEFRKIHKKYLNVDYECQRKRVSASLINDIAREWDWMACGALCVARREDGTLWVFDGQHRLWGAKKRSDIHELPCMIWDAENKSVEARAFLKHQDKRNNQSWVDRIRIASTEGDEAAQAAQNLVEYYGMKFVDGKQSGGVQCTSTVYKGIKEDSNAMEKAFHAAWCIGEGAITQDIVSGLFHLERQLKKEGKSVTTMIPRLQKIGEHRIMQSISSAKEFLGTGGNKARAQGILSIYNKGLKTNKIDI